MSEAKPSKGQKYHRRLFKLYALALHETAPSGPAGSAEFLLRGGEKGPSFPLERHSRKKTELGIEMVG